MWWKAAPSTWEPSGWRFHIALLKRMLSIKKSGPYVKLLLVATDCCLYCSSDILRKSLCRPGSYQPWVDGSRFPRGPRRSRLTTAGSTPSDGWVAAHTRAQGWACCSNETSECESECMWVCVRACECVCVRGGLISKLLEKDLLTNIFSQNWQKFTIYISFPNFHLKHVLSIKLTFTKGPDQMILFKGKTRKTPSIRKQNHR